MFNGPFLYRKLLTYASADEQPLLGRTRDQLSEVNNHRQNFILLCVCCLSVLPLFVLVVFILISSRAPRSPF